ncbi:hypothetical protein [Paracoccus sp. (in: a-proteobacteria)]|uniref:hypothetical protein n=1 Tax=Paracoccus sp. TaxID=267 RepID=UPI00391B769B
MTLSQRQGAVAAGAMLIAVVAAPGGHSQAQAQVQNSSPSAALAVSHPPQRGIAIGDIVSRDQIHLVTRPGAYGLSNPPAGNGYAIVSGHLVRIDVTSGKILSALRRVERILD